MSGLLRFLPVYQTRVWGGRSLETLFHRTLPSGDPIGESWELSARDEAPSRDADGTTLAAHWTEHRDWFGKDAPAGDRFPLLVKLLDARDDLSLQVHPPAALAPSLGGEPKTEAWVFLHCEPGAAIYAGLKAGVTRATFEQAIAEGRVAECFHRIEPRVGDVMFLPSGRVHAIGAGNVILEVQQNSDTTYRVYDWDRVGLDGKPRELHVEASLKCIDFDDHEPALAVRDGACLVKCDLFSIWEWTESSTAEIATAFAGRFASVFVMDGRLEIAGEELGQGDSAVVKAGDAFASARWLEVGRAFVSGF
jgi:mannose-6-phosphate isomerase